MHIRSLKTLTEALERFLREQLKRLPLTAACAGVQHHASPPVLLPSYPRVGTWLKPAAAFGA